MSKSDTIVDTVAKICNINPKAVKMCFTAYRLYLLHEIAKSEDGSVDIPFPVLGTLSVKYNENNPELSVNIAESEKLIDAFRLAKEEHYDFLYRELERKLSDKALATISTYLDGVEDNG